MIGVMAALRDPRSGQAQGGNGVDRLRRRHRPNRKRPLRIPEGAFLFVFKES